MAATKKVGLKICPIGLASELVCDKWMPIILRDIGLFERRTFNKLLKYNLEGISSGSLATKLKRLEHVGLINFVLTSEHRQKKLYYLTESGIEFLPVLFSMAGWSAKWHHPSKEFSAKIEPYLTSPASKWHPFLHHSKLHKLLFCRPEKTQGQIPNHSLLLIVQVFRLAIVSSINNLPH